MTDDFDGFVEVQKVRHYVYLLFQSGRLVYIGMSSKIHARLEHHKRYDQVLIKEFNTREEARRIEHELIYKYQPPRNIADKYLAPTPANVSVNLKALGININKKHKWDTECEDN